MDERRAEVVRRARDTSPFYRRKLRDLPPGAAWETLPFTTKQELVEDQLLHPPFGSNLTEPLERYTRLHQTSGTTGRPLRWLDTPASWAWWLRCWHEVYAAAGVTAADRVFVPFSFGPFVGFWSAFEAAQALGALVVPGGGMGSVRRLDVLREVEATVVVATPTYALRLAEVAREQGVDLAEGPVRVTIHAGEPGASLPSIRDRLATTWGARVVDHVGATEVGAWGFSCGVGDHVHVNEAEFVAEVLASGSPSDDDGATERGELVLTNLGRLGSPVLRYRTGDLVELDRRPCPCGRSSAFLRGGVRGRVDGMLVVRGVNVYPSAVEEVVFGVPEVAELEMRTSVVRGLGELLVRIEGAGAAAELAAEVREALRRRLGLRVEVEVVAPGTLPRYELKARRVRAIDGAGPGG